jgi:hypothetical protein
MSRFYFPLLAALALFPFTALHADDMQIPGSAAQRMARYNVVWNSPSKDATGVMPLGNGDIAAGVYAIENGDLFLLLSKNDAYNYMGDLFKTGRVRIVLSPNPFAQGKPFRQTLDLSTGSILIEADGVTLRIWADANRPLYHVQIQSPREIAVTAKPEFWERFDSCVYNVSELYTQSAGMPPRLNPPQDVSLQRGSHLLWYFPVGDRSVLSDDLKYYGVESMAGKFPDPFRFNTFGSLLESPDLKLAAGALSGSGRSFDIRIHSLTMQTPKPGTWIAAIEELAAQPVDLASDWAAHCRWWRDFWNRSWIVATDTTVPAENREKFSGEPTAAGMREEADGAALVSQSYNVFRFLMACQSRGRVPAKFNGGILTQQLHLRSSDTRNRSGAVVLMPGGDKLTHPDDRLWGRRFTYQNQRLLYWPLLASGDFDLMKPFFAYYFDLLPMRAAITRAWFGHDGAYYRENTEPTGGERDCGRGDGDNQRPPRGNPGPSSGWYHSYYFTGGLETTAMMIDYVNFTGDAAFRDAVLVPFAREILLFFDQHYRRDAQGRLSIDPGQVLETWWIATNPAPDVAGLRFTLDGLLAINAGTPDDRRRWTRFRAEIPEVPMRIIGGKEAIAPAAKFEMEHNSENGELYPVFPFRCFGVGLGSGDIVQWTMENRTCKDMFGDTCWTQDQIDWAFAGSAAEAARGLVRRFRTASTMCRFPMYGKEAPDSCPDFDHFGAGSIALQRMLLQEAGGKILLLPAWPREWNVDFKLHAAAATVVEASVRDGKIISLKVTPESSRQRIVICPAQGLASPAPSPRLVNNPG